MNTELLSTRLVCTEMTDAPSNAEMTSNGLDSASATPWPGEGFEDRRALAAIRGRLFGNAKNMWIGRYRIDGRLGAGGMGEVYLGFDSELDRKVAIKCVRPELDDAIQHQRLRREARALAQLSHPNVVVVYEVDEHEGQTYVAMEFVEGQTLATWLEQPRRWQDILEQFIAAGRGLVAAHSAGVVHRDFKPENVLLGADGRVRVVDFGLAISDGVPGVAGSGGALSRLTDAGRIAGTVRYMPLEQLRGAEVGPHTDQFAFCVSLYEALWGRYPFALGSVAARVEALEQDQLRLPPAGLPRRLWTVIRRGLAREPEQRWPDLEALLEALTAVPLRRRRLMFGAAGVCVAALLGGWPLLASDPDQCAAVESELEGVWDTEVSARAQVAFSKVGAGASFPRVDRALDEWAAAWLGERRGQCDAAQARRDDEALTRARRSCLEGQRRRVAVLGAALADATPELVERAVVMVGELPDPAACTADRVTVDPLLDRGIREQVDALRRELAEIEQLRLLGRGRRARAQELVEAAGELGYPPLLAEALAEQGRTELAAGSAKRALALLEAAGDLALEAGRDRLVAEIWLELALHQLTEYPDLALGQRNAKLAAAQWARLDPDAHTRARLSFVAGRIARSEGDDEAAAAAYRRALDELGGAQNEARPRYLVNLAEVLEPFEAIVLRREALEVAEQMWGPSHPDTGGYAFILGRALYQADRREQARPLFDRAIDSWTATHREPHPDLARAHELMVVIALEEYREANDDAEREAALEQAQEHAQLVASIRAQTLPSIHRGHGDAAMQLSRLAGLRGDRATALALALEALQHYRETLGSGAPEVLALQLDIADSELGLGRIERARAGYQSVVERTADPAHRVRAELGLAEIALRQGELQDARAHIEAIEELGKEHLRGQILSLAILSAVVDLRRGCRSCTSKNRGELSELVAQAGWSQAVIRGWLQELGLDAREVAALGFE